MTNIKELLALGASDYKRETPIVLAVLAFLKDRGVTFDARSAVLARALGAVLYEDFHGNTDWLNKVGPILIDIIQAHAATGVDIS